MTHRCHKAFTLIELLVVITIIVTLLALLTPALDKAIYQAELAVCATTQKSVATGALMYAMDFKRRYTLRWGMHNNVNYKPNHVFLRDLVFPSNNRLKDDRVRLRPYMGINNSLNDVLAPQKVNFESSIYTDLEVSTHLYFGFQWVGEAGMFKVGDRFSFTTDHDGDTVATRFRFDWLASDLDVPNHDPQQVVAGHPDKDGVMGDRTEQDSAQGVPTANASTDAVKWTFSRWENPDTMQRGTIDTNYASADGSVTRFIDVRWDESDPVKKTAERMIFAPLFSGGYPVGQWDIRLARQGN